VSGVVEIYDFTVSRCRIFVLEIQITSALITYYDVTPIWIPVGTNKDDLECPIQLNVRLSHGLLADSVGTSLASLLHSCKTDGVLSEVHDQ